MVARSQASAQAERLQTLFATRLGLRRGPLRVRVRQARRSLPAELRRDAEAVARAAELCGHPRLEAQIDEAGIVRAADRVARYLDGPAARQRRVTARLRWLAGLAGNLLLVAALLLVVLRWRGFV